jgi:hypothetical protein
VSYEDLLPMLPSSVVVRSMRSSTTHVALDHAHVLWPRACHGVGHESNRIRDRLLRRLKPNDVTARIWIRSNVTNSSSETGSSPSPSLQNSDSSDPFPLVWLCRQSRDAVFNWRLLLQRQGLMRGRGSVSTGGMRQWTSSLDGKPAHRR